MQRREINFIFIVIKISFWSLRVWKFDKWFVPNFVTYLKFFILCQKIINVLLQQIHECEYFEKKIQMSIVVWIFVWISLIMMLWQSVFSINYTFLCFLIIKCKQYNNKISTKKIWLNHYMRIISASETWLKKNLFAQVFQNFC